MSKLFLVWIQASLRLQNLQSGLADRPKTKLTRYMNRSGNFRRYIYFRLRNYFRPGMRKISGFFGGNSAMRPKDHGAAVD